MTAEPGILLDVSRLVSRLGRGPLTGIDRVEAEWLDHLQGRDHLLLCRVSGGQLLLPPAAGALLLGWSAGDLSDLPAPGLLDRLRGRNGAPHRAQAALRRMAVAATTRRAHGLGDRAAARLGAGAVYLNLGHANWDRRVFAALSPLHRAVLIHDTIPLDHPEFTRKGQSQVFRDRFMVAVGMADLVLTVSQASADAVALWRGRLAIARRAPIVATPIGTRLAPAGNPPQGLDLTRPFFVTLGTIEPRKNHALLLDVWDRLARDLPPADLPRLFIIGRRGWENHDTFARLDALPQDGPVREFNDLDDATVAALLERSYGLLMPSRAEGFGLPLTEAAGRGIPVLATPLAAAREMLGDYAIWLDPDDPAAWAETILRMAKESRQRLPQYGNVTWQQHFESVHRVIDEARRLVYQTG
ncbi:glycosyltransferase family 1 protein [Paracoccus sp. DMF-8]|uniref:glycosyltransferase family 4 protein n=1 Tax=Paracoccus sp. DMF-8 TaxID=3019445 RepID=UPI0023E8E4A5|nr:glycosyltransferase family 1 protein [Paracoccus sp. DMF-8]MDF3606922.1 glycosyltransferase family 1 protein [Paracoccus sp. DMF-8]